MIPPEEFLGEWTTGCKVGVVKTTIFHVDHFANRHGVVVQHMDDNGIDTDSKDYDGKNIAESIPQFVKHTRGYAHVKFVDCAVEVQVPIVIKDDEEE
jgi:hypothetical protein